MSARVCSTRAAVPPDGHRRVDHRRHVGAPADVAVRDRDVAGERLHDDVPGAVHGVRLGEARRRGGAVEPGQVHVADPDPGEDPAVVRRGIPEHRAGDEGERRREGQEERGNEGRHRPAGALPPGDRHDGGGRDLGGPRGRARRIGPAAGRVGSGGAAVRAVGDVGRVGCIGRVGRSRDRARSPERGAGVGHRVCSCGRAGRPRGGSIRAPDRPVKSRRARSRHPPRRGSPGRSPPAPGRRRGRRACAAGPGRSAALRGPWSSPPSRRPRRGGGRGRAP